MTAPQDLIIAEHVAGCLDRGNKRVQRQDRRGGCRGKFSFQRDRQHGHNTEESGETIADRCRLGCILRNGTGEQSAAETDQCGHQQDADPDKKAGVNSAELCPPFRLKDVLVESGPEFSAENGEIIRHILQLQISHGDKDQNTAENEDHGVEERGFQFPGDQGQRGKRGHPQCIKGAAGDFFRDQTAADTGCKQCHHTQLEDHRRNTHGIGIELFRELDRDQGHQQNTDNEDRRDRT